MNSVSKFVLLSSVAVFAMPASTAIAQVANASKTAATATADSDGSPNDIVVTARKVKETLQDTPLAVSVVTGESLERTGFVQVSEIARFIPGFSLSPLNTTRATGSKIRGINTFSFSDGFESSVSTVVDGVVLGRESQGFTDFLDISAIEVIKGPQGTLFGKNASAGVVNIRTNDPEFSYGAIADASYGSFNEFKFRGTVTGPVAGDKLAFRVSGTYNRRDGVLQNAIAGQPDLNDRDTYAVRAKLLYQPSDALKIKLTGDYEHENNHCCLPTFRVAGAPTPAVLFATNPGVLQLRDALAAVGIVAGPGNRKVDVLASRIGENSQFGGVALNIDYDFGNTSLSSITAYRKTKIDEFNEADGVSNSNLNDRNGTKVTTEQFTQELRVNGKVGSLVDYVGGLFFFHQDLEAHGRVDIAFGLPFPPFFNVRTIADRTVGTDSYAAYGEATINLTKRASLILGGRYTHDTITATYTRVSTALNAAAPFAPFFGPNVTGIQTVKNDNFSGRVIGRYFVTDDLMAYVSFSRGYKGPGIDVAESVAVSTIATPGGLPVLAPEIPTLYEGGIRSTLFDKALTTNITIYSQDIKNLQTISTNSVGAVVNMGIDKLRSKGIEAEIILRPKILPGLTLSGSYTLNDIKIAKYTARPDLVGKRFRDNSHDFFSVTGDYRTKLSDSGFEGFVRAEYAYQSSKNTDLGLRSFANVDAYGLLNLRIGVNAPDNRYGVTFSVENATNQVYANFILPSSYNALDGTTTAQFIGDPRTWKVTLHGKF